MRLPENLRDQLKIPLGKLIPNSQVNPENVRKHIADSPFIITVGDATTEKMIGFGIIPSLQIIDCVEKRQVREPPTSSSVKTHFECDNPPGEITVQSIEIIKKSLQSQTPVRITVNGEEDLLVIPVCVFAPDNAIVLYGQPHEGLVIVQVNDEIRNKTQTLLNSMN